MWLLSNLGNFKLHRENTTSMDQVNIPLLKGFGLHLDGAKIF